MSSLGADQLDMDADTLRSAMADVVQAFIAKSEQPSVGPISKVIPASKSTTFEDLTKIGPAHDISKVIKETLEVFDYRLRLDHPRFMGLIPGPVLPVSWVGDCLARAFNALGASTTIASGPNAIENSLIQWLGSCLGFPTGCGGIFVSGGSMANMMGIVIGRDQRLEPGEEGLGMIYITEQTHYSIIKALRVLGFRQNQICCVQGDDAGRMDAGALESCVKEHRASGLKPFLVIGTCGTTSTGAVDPFKKLADACSAYNMWLHVDGAFGASVALSKMHNYIAEDLKYADSISWDAHKWLFQTYSCGTFLTRNKKNLAASFANGGDYLGDGSWRHGDSQEFWDFGMELSRPAARAMKLWFSLRVLGVDKVSNMIDQGIALAEKAELEFRRMPQWEILSSASLGIMTFRFVPGIENMDVDALNEHVSRVLMERNVAGVPTTKVRGKKALRLCIINPLISQRDLSAMVTAIDQVAKEVLEKLVMEETGGCN